MTCIGPLPTRSIQHTYKTVPVAMTPHEPSLSPSLLVSVGTRAVDAYAKHALCNRKIVTPLHLQLFALAHSPGPFPAGILNSPQHTAPAAMTRPSCSRKTSEPALPYPHNNFVCWPSEKIWVGCSSSLAAAQSLTHCHAAQQPPALTLGWMQMKHHTGVISGAQ